MFVLHAGEIWTKPYGPNYQAQIFELFDKKKKKKKNHGVFKTIFDKALAPFWKTFL